MAEYNRGADGKFVGGGGDSGTPKMARGGVSRSVNRTSKALRGRGPKPDYKALQKATTLAGMDRAIYGDKGAARRWKSRGGPPPAYD